MITRNSLKVHVHNQIDCKKKMSKMGPKNPFYQEEKPYFFKDFL